MTQVHEQMSRQESSLKFIYESGASASFLVVRCECEVIGYQVQMLEHNLIRHVIPSELIRKEGVSHFYYNITSMVPLTFLLKRRKLCREEFLKLILHITSAVNDTSGYLLEISSFIFDPEYIYINPETMEPFLVYVPADIGTDGRQTLQSFISDLLLMHIHAEGFDRGNFVQKILSAVNSDFFNVKECAALMSKLMYEQEQNAADEQPAEPISDECRIERSKNERIKGDRAKSDRAINYKTKKDRLKSDGKEKDRVLEVPDYKSSNTGRKKAVIIAAVLLQFIMGGIIYLSRGFLQRIGNNQSTTYAAVAMIVLAIDLLLFKKIKANELIFLRDKPGEQEKEGATVKERPDMRPYPDGQDRQQQQGSQPHLRRQRSQPGEKPSSRRQRSQPERQLHQGRWRSQQSKQPQTDIQTDIHLQLDRQSNGHLQADGHLQLDRQPDRQTQSDRQGGYFRRTYAENVHMAHTPDYEELSQAKDERAACKTELLTRDKKGVLLLRSVGKHGINEDIVIDKDEFIIGRLSGHVDYVLNNKAVGKLHAELIRRDGTCFVRDLNSMNGTFINNQRIESNKEYELKENDRLLLANSEFVLIYD